MLLLNWTSDRTPKTIIGIVSIRPVLIDPQ